MHQTLTVGFRAWRGHHHYLHWPYVVKWKGGDKRSLSSRENLNVEGWGIFVFSISPMKAVAGKGFYGMSFKNWTGWDILSFPIAWKVAVVEAFQGWSLKALSFFSDNNIGRNRGVGWVHLLSVNQSLKPQLECCSYKPQKPLEGFRGGRRLT